MASVADDELQPPKCSSYSGLIVLFGAGFVATSGRNVSHQYLTFAGIALFGVVAALAVVLVLGAHPAVAGRAGR